VSRICAGLDEIVTAFRGRPLHHTAFPYVFLRFVEELASRQPLLLVFEDIDWADASQLDLLESLASRVRDVPVMFWPWPAPSCWTPGRPGERG
jgi:AAA ATPase domain